MATLTITIPDTVATRVYTALCIRANTPVSGANAKLVVIDFIKATVRAQEGEVAAVSARTTASTAVDTDIVLT